MNISRARRTLARAEPERDRVKRHLLVAAALRDVLATDPIVVGGLAEDVWAAGMYRQTDLDLCAPVSPAELESLTRLGFAREGRHWYHERAAVAVEFPDSRIDGDPQRTVEIELGEVSARVIGVEDLYLDRVRQATIDEAPSNIAFRGAVAVAAARYEEIDWKYVRSRISAVRKADPLVGEAMSRRDRLARSRARRAASAP